MWDFSSVERNRPISLHPSPFRDLGTGRRVSHGYQGIVHQPQLSVPAFFRFLPQTALTGSSAITIANTRKKTPDGGRPATHAYIYNECSYAQYRHEFRKILHRQSIIYHTIISKIAWTNPNSQYGNLKQFRTILIPHNLKNTPSLNICENPTSKGYSELVCAKTLCQTTT